MKIILNESVYRQVNIIKEINLSSFKIQETLNPEIFDEHDKMKKDVRKKLMKIGEDFYKFLGVDWVDMVDIILTGSLANYNWSKFSDVDLHVLIPYSKVAKNLDLVNDLMWSKKELWNKEHDIKIKNYQVEMYAQNSDLDNDLVAGGVYSVLYDRWIKKPVRVESDFNESRIDSLVSDIENNFEDILRRFIGGNTFGIVSDIDDLKDGIRDLRQQGLGSGGELSDENIAFKAIRRLGLFDKMDDLRDKIYDDSLSIDDSDSEIKKNKVAEPTGTKKADKEKDRIEKKPVKKGLGRYMIKGKRYISLRDAEKQTGIPKSTIEYRVKSDKPEFSSYREMPI